MDHVSVLSLFQARWHCYVEFISGTLPRTKKDGFDRPVGQILSPFWFRSWYMYIYDYIGLYMFVSCPYRSSWLAHNYISFLPHRKTDCGDCLWATRFETWKKLNYISCNVILRTCIVTCHPIPPPPPPPPPLSLSLSGHALFIDEVYCVNIPVQRFYVLC